MKYLTIKFLHWFFCKINDPIWSPSRFGACCHCGKIHGKSDYAKQAHIKLGQVAEGFRKGMIMPTKTIRLFNLAGKDPLIIGLREIEDGGYFITEANAILLATEIDSLQRAYAASRNQSYDECWSELLHQPLPQENE